MKTKNFFLFLITLIILSGCSGAKDALQGKKRSDTSDEFFIEKKNPIPKPPDFNELPLPQQTNQVTQNEENKDIKSLLTDNKDSDLDNQNTNQNTNFENSIIEKIKNN